MKSLCRLVLLLLLSIVCGATSVSADEEGFVKLFDGKTFKGWEGNLDIFRIEDQAIVGGTLEKRIPHNEFLCTKKEYGDFELRLKAKLAGQGNNAGIQFRSKRMPNHHEVIGYQCDMGGQPTQNIWGALYDESRRRKFLAVGDQDGVKKAFKPDAWNEFVIRCQGNRIQIWLNGFQTVDYIEKEDVAAKGIIGLQIHGGKPAEASYRDIRIKVL